METRDKLMHAARAGDAKTISLLLNSDPSLLNARDENGWTMLCHAALHGHTELVQLLIQRGADVRLNQPIHYAGQRRHKDICRLLVNAGAVDHLPDSTDPSALAAYRAMYSYDTTALTDLLAHQPGLVNIPQTSQSTMLHEAATNGAIEILNLLIHAGADVNAKNAKGQTPLDRALVHNQIDAARSLIDHGALCDAASAVKCGSAQKLAQLLDSDPSLLQSRDADGCSLLRAAILLGHKNVVSLLLERGIDDPNHLGRAFLEGRVFENARMVGTLFRDVNLAGSVFQNVNLSNAAFHYLNLADASIDYANIAGLKIFGIEVAPLVEAELAKKRDPPQSQ